MIFLHVKKGFRERSVEWLLATCLFTWGLVLLNPDYHTFDAPRFAALAAVASETVWGWLCTIAGLARLTGLAINGAWRRSPHLRVAGSVLGILAWVQISLGFIVSDTGSTGMAIYPVFVAFDLWALFRAAGDTRAADEGGIYGGD